MEHRNSLLDEVGEIVRSAVGAILDSSFYSSKKVSNFIHTFFFSPDPIFTEIAGRPMLSPPHVLKVFAPLGERLDPYDPGRLPARARGFEPAQQVFAFVRSLPKKRGGLSLSRVAILGWALGFYLCRALGERSYPLPRHSPCGCLASDGTYLEWNWCRGDGHGSGGLASTGQSWHGPIA